MHTLGTFYGPIRVKYLSTPWFDWFPRQLTVVSVASQTPNATQKSMGVPVNMALGQQILTMHQPTAVSPSKGVSSHSAAQVSIL